MDSDAMLGRRALLDSEEPRWRTPAFRRRNQQIALAYADLSRNWTLGELAEVYGISDERVRQIVAVYCPHITRLRAERRQAQRADAERARRARRRRLPPHGTHRRYRRGCRCDRCRKSNADRARLAYHSRKAQRKRAP